MPLIIICGLPCSGKTTCTNNLVNYFTSNKNIKTHVISEEDLPRFQRNELFSNPSKEKEVRSFLKSEVHRYINKDDILILNSPNYIKGYRYELYCVGKSSQTPQCVIHCDVNVDEAKRLNSMRLASERYDDDVFDGLIMRFEAPDSRNRWDSPLFLLRPTLDEDMPLEAIHDSVMLRKPPPPHNSTLPQPLAPTNFLHELDRLTQSALQEIIEGQKNCVPGDKIKTSLSNEKVNFLKPFSAIELQKLRRQFITYMRSRPPSNTLKIIDMFIDYINNRS